MLPAKSSRIVNLASMARLNGVGMSATYVATKHAVRKSESWWPPNECILKISKVVGLTKGAAVDYATDGVTINAVAPGAIKTDILQYAIDDGSYSEESIAAMFPMKRLGVPSDVARAISFLLNSPFATGTILSVDSGFSA